MNRFPQAPKELHKQRYYLTDPHLKLGVTQAHTNLWPSNINGRSQGDRGISVGPCLGAFSNRLGPFSAPFGPK